MTITYSPHLRLPEFERTALKRRFMALIALGELRPGNCEEYQLDGYVLAPSLAHDEDKGEMVITGYQLMSKGEWQI